LKKLPINVLAAKQPSGVHPKKDLVAIQEKGDFSKCKQVSVKIDGTP